MADADASVPRESQVPLFGIDSRGEPYFATARKTMTSTTDAMKKKMKAMSADFSAIFDALPRNDQFRLYS